MLDPLTLKETLQVARWASTSSTSCEPCLALCKAFNASPIAWGVLADGGLRGPKQIAQGHLLPLPPHGYKGQQLLKMLDIHQRSYTKATLASAGTD